MTWKRHFDGARTRALARTVAAVGLAAWFVPVAAIGAGRAPRTMYARAVAAARPPGHEWHSDTQHEAVHHLTATYDRRASSVLVRCVDTPTRANLDFAAWDRNAMRAQARTQRPTRPSAPTTRPDLTFGGALAPGSVTDDLSDTPLTADERARPMSWRPAMQYLADWDYAEGSAFAEPGWLIEDERWNDDGSVTCQEITRLFLRSGSDGGVEAWVEVEFKPWAPLLDGVTDGDGDGFPELFGRLDARSMREPAARRLRDDYAGRALSAHDIRSWERDLVEEWYGPYYASAMDASAREVVPNVDSDPDVRAELGHVVLSSPAVAIRAEPRGKAMYTFLVIGCSRP
ncbi:hypothetical protein CMK11_00475 [Candidatus Poribacteria bacterium]|nr:hypothetical protein [Candidatus Poribacteria bacterium]